MATATTVPSSLLKSADTGRLAGSDPRLGEYIGDLQKTVRLITQLI
jgi:hypothetical protein